MIISTKHKFVYIAVPKTATVATEAVLGHYNQLDDLPKHGPLSFAEKRLGTLDGHIVGMTVRNPWDWLVSRYLHSQVLGMALTFRQWWDAADRLSVTEQGFDPKARTFQDMGLDGRGRFAVTILMRMEHLQNDFDRFCNACQIPRCPIPRAHENPLVREHYSLYYRGQDGVRQAVKKHFAWVIQRCGYTFEEAPHA